jgi:CHAT domain-containing protein
LLIVADGVLHYVPFAALSVPQGAERGCPAEASYCPLIVDHEVVSLPSASAVSVIRAEQHRRPRASKTLAIFSDPVFDAGDPRVRAASAPGPGSRFDRLPFSRREAAAIAALAPRERTLNAIDFDANREAVTDPALADYRFVHFATHGVVDSQHPELSGLVLSLVDRSGRARDGFLRAHELYNLDLRADLVVLSACRTALGKEIKGEGVVGLVRGFMYAGSPRVVSSLWDVRDAATAELMTQMYRRMLSEGFTAAAALRSAQLSMWRRGQYQAPFYWGAFILQGEWR